MNSFASKFKWRIIGIHLLAVFFLSLALGEFLYFSDFELLEAMLDHTSKLTLNTILLQENGTERLTRFMMLTQSSAFIATLFGSIVSLIICLKMKISWLNSMLVFLLFFALYKLLFKEPIDFDGRIQSLENWMNQIGIAIRLITFGTFYLATSMILFFKFGGSRKSNALSRETP